jgi:hypothetical protein
MLTSWMSWILAWRPSKKKALRASELFHVHVISSVEPLACNKNMLTWTWHHRTFHYIDIFFFPPSLTLQQEQGGIWKPIQSSRLAESQLMIQPDGSNNQQAGNSDVQTQNEKARISNRMFPRSWKRNAAPSDLWSAWAVLNLLRLTCHIDIDWVFLGSRSQRQEGILHNVDRTFLDPSTWFFSCLAAWNTLKTINRNPTEESTILWRVLFSWFRQTSDFERFITETIDMLHWLSKISTEIWNISNWSWKCSEVNELNVVNFGLETFNEEGIKSIW